MILSAAMLLRHGLGREEEAAAVESAVDAALDGGLRTRDLGGDATTDEATDAVSPTSKGRDDVKQADLIWMNGEFVPWDDAKVHVLTHGLHYGTGVFEGVRCYDTEIGPAVFRHARPPRPAVRLGRALLHADPVRDGADPRRRRSSSSRRNGLR